MKWQNMWDGRGNEEIQIFGRKPWRKEPTSKT